MEPTDIKRQEILQALEWGRGPTVELVPNLQCRGDAGGCDRKAHPHPIEVEANLVQRFENGE